MWTKFWLIPHCWFNSSDFWNTKKLFLRHSELEINLLVCFRSVSYFTAQGVFLCFMIQINIWKLLLYLSLFEFKMDCMIWNTYVSQKKQKLRGFTVPLNVASNHNFLNLLSFAKSSFQHINNFQPFLMEVLFYLLQTPALKWAENSMIIVTAIVTLFKLVNCIENEWDRHYVHLNVIKYDLFTQNNL